MEINAELLGWLTQLGLPGLVIAGLVYLGRVWIINRPKTPSHDQLIQSMVTAMQEQNNELILNHNESITELTLAVGKLTESVDELIGKNLGDRMHGVENCASSLCDRTRRLEDYVMGETDPMLPVIQGPSNYANFLEARKRSGKSSK